jgi:hypothetical protein
MSSKLSTALLLLVILGASIAGCGMQVATLPVPDAKSVHSDKIWLTKVKNSTGLPLLLPSNNPLRSLAEMAGKSSSEYRENVMDLLRDTLRQELEQKGYGVKVPEEVDARFPPLPAEDNGAVRLAREGKLSGLVFVSEIWRWEGEPQKFVRASVDFKLIRIDDGAVLWERRIQRAVSTPSATNLGQAATDAVREIVRDLFA